LESVGVRSGLSSSSDENRFSQTEAYTRWNVPTLWALGREWHLRPQVDLSVGWLTGRGEDGFVGTFGPAFKLQKGEFPLALVGGVSGTVLSHEVFRNKNFGMWFQFTSNVGLQLRLGSHLDLGYRFQHMSNAGLSNHNPGLNLHMFTAGYAF
jgi:hypothetical protein